MDRISGVLPQIRWSPQLVPAAPKAAPATTVEVVRSSADTAGRMGANVDTGSGTDFVARIRGLLRQDGAGERAGANPAGPDAAGAIVPRIEAAPDPDAPTGPPPAFEVTPLEAHVAALRARPRPLHEVSSLRASAGKDLAATGAVQVAPMRPAVAPEQASATVPPSDERPAVVPRGAWPLGAEVRGAVPPGPSLDVTR